MGRGGGGKALGRCRQVRAGCSRGSAAAAAPWLHPHSQKWLFPSFCPLTPPTDHAACAALCPRCSNLYDVFVAIRDDEVEHSKTMAACATNSIALDLQNAEGMIRYARDQNILSVDGSIDLD